MYMQKEKSKTGAHTQICTHASQRTCDSQNARPEGCCVSDVCIVYSVALMRVADLCTLGPPSGLMLFTKMFVDIRLLSKKAK